MSAPARALRLIAVWAALAALPIALRAEVTPVNPLRNGTAAVRRQSIRSDAAPGSTPAEHLQQLAEDWQNEPVQPEIQLVQSTEDLLQPQPQTVVPRSFGERQQRPYAYPAGQEYDEYPPSVEEDWPGPHPAGRMRGWFHSFHLLPVHWFWHSDPNDPYRHTGMGEPLIGTSWRNRPWYVGLFVGGIFNDDLVDGEVLQNNAVFLGARIGWDFDHYWGIEGRYAFARAEALTGAGVPITESARDYYGDVSLLYYPWGDARWRPYASLGIGLANFRFRDELGYYINDSAFGLPIGVGIKSYYCNWFTLRLDLVDNIAFGTNQISSMHNFSVMAGVEFRFGGKSPSYFPWHGNTVYW